MATPSPSTPIIDHIVVLIPSPLLDDPPAFLSENLTIIPGGVHAGGATHNKLIVLPDGVYIELIAFTPSSTPEQRAAHRWGARPEGTIVDWALTLPGTGDAFNEIQGRVAAATNAVVYEDPVPGGRVTPAGRELQWATAAPRAVDGSNVTLDSGEAPFWCLDRTPRRLRVPADVAGNVTHPCGAVGLSGLSVWVDGREALETLRGVYNGIFGRQGDASMNGTFITWTAEVPEHSTGRSAELSLSLREDGKKGTLVKLALFSTLRGGIFGGVLHDGLELEIHSVLA